MMYAASAYTLRMYFRVKNKRKAPFYRPFFIYDENLIKDGPDLYEKNFYYLANSINKTFNWLTITGSIAYVLLSFSFGR